MISRRIVQVCNSLLALVVLNVAPAQGQEYPLDQELGSSVIAGCAADVRPPNATSSRGASDRRVKPPSNGLYAGLYQIPTNPRDIVRFANATGRVPPIVFSFHDLFNEANRGETPDRAMDDAMEGDGAVTPLQLAQYLNDQGSVLALSWAVYCCDYERTAFWLRLKRPYDTFNRILRGDHDEFLRRAARQIRDADVPIMLTVVPEFNWQGAFLFGADGRRWIDGVDNICNAYGDPSWPDGPERVRDLFIRVIDIFRQEGADNVTWFMYGANNYMAPGVEGQSRWLHPKYFYPGDDYIDWVGQSTYFTAPEWAGRYEDVGTFGQSLDGGYNAWRSVTDKPIFLPEFGLTAEPSDDRRPVWNTLMTRWLRDRPGIKAITIADSELFSQYFNLPRLSTNGPDLSLVQPFLQSDPYFNSPRRLGN